ncbi:MAG: TonB-dependent receptor [Acidobacteria bacterium]|nr:TonB-dependent receptor [Acidobacteriota bacterium]
MTMRPLGFLLFLSFFLTASVVARPAGVYAQSTAGAIAGTVTDQTGGSLPGVTVVVKRAETGATRTLMTDGRGRYHASELESGEYEVSAELQGFQTTVRRGLRLTLGQELGVNLVMALGQLSEQLVVTEAAPLVETTRSAIAHLVDERQIRELPLNGRDFSQLTLLQPGVIGSPTTTRSLDRGMGTQVSVAGARPNQISYLLDGTDANTMGNQSPGSAAGGALGVETVREFQVLVNNYSAEYGRSTGGIVSAVTRSGSNTLHGSAFEFHRNDALDAKNFFDPADEPIPPLTRNQFGGYAGGPVKKDKLFFFGSYEGLREDKGLSLAARGPSRATRARTDMSPAVRPYLLMYPEPNGPETGASGLFITSANEPTDEDFFVAKVDYRISEKDSLSVRYSYDDATLFTPDDLLLFGLNQHTRKQYLMGEHKRIFSPNVLNVARVAWNKPFEEDSPANLVNVNESLFFIPGTQFGFLDVSGLTGLGPDTGTPTFFDFKSLQVMSTLTWTAGRHVLKTGGSFQRWFNDNDSNFTLGGQYRFNSIDDFVRNRTNRFEGTVPGSTTDRQWRQNLVGFFVQDDFSVRDRLTLNLGVRYEFFTVPTEAQNRIARLEHLSDPAPQVGPPAYKNPSFGNIAPRVGFAWAMTADGKTSLRGGGGYFYEPILTNVTRTYMNRMPPFFQAANIRNPPFPNPFGASLVPQNRLDLFPFDPENPLRLQYNLTLQREVLPRTVVTAGYMGSRGFHQIRNIEANQAIPQVLSDGRLFFPAGQGRRNPNFESMRLRTTDGNSWYNGFILNASKRFSRGLMLQAAYTLGKSIDEGSQAVGSADFRNSSQPRFGFDRADNKGPSDFDIRHNFVFNYSYELPLGDGLTGVAGALARGWQVSGIVTARSGVPFTPFLGFDHAGALPRSGGAGQRPNWASGRNPGNTIMGSPDRYFDPTAFTLPDPGFFGDVRRNELTGPGFATWDMAVFKNVTLHGDSRLQFRLEVFNALNRANFGLPASTVFNSRGLVENAGEITETVGTARQIQLGVKIEF